MIREDRELLAELARVNSDVAPLALRLMDDRATAEEQQDLGERLICIGRRLRRRAAHAGGVVEGHVDVEIAQAAHGPVPNQEP